MSADKGKPACVLPPRERPLVEAGAKACVDVVDPVCLFFSCGVTRRVRMSGPFLVEQTDISRYYISGQSGCQQEEAGR